MLQTHTTDSPVNPGPSESLVGVSREGAFRHEALGAATKPCRRNCGSGNAFCGRDDEAVEPPDVVSGVAVSATEPENWKIIVIAVGGLLIRASDNLTGFMELQLGYKASSQSSLGNVTISK